MTSNPRTPTYRLHKPSGQAVVTIDGRDVYLGFYGTDASRERYDREIGLWLQNDRCQLVEAASITIVELIAAYNRHIEAYYVKDGQPTSEVASFKLALCPLRELYGRTAAASFGPLALKNVRERMLGLGWCRTVVNRNVLRVRQMFRWGVGNELVPSAVYEALKAVSGLRRGYSSARESDPVRPVPDAHVDALRPHVSKQVWAIIELQRLTGMRSGEVLIMRGCDLDTTGDLWLYTPSTHKTEHHGHARAIELGPKAQAIIKPFLRQNLEAFLFSAADAVANQKADKRKRRKSKVQPSQRDRSKANPELQPGDRYTTDSYRRAISRGCEKAWPVPDEIAEDLAKAAAWRKAHSWHPHQLRHNFATRIRKEHGVEAARILLGHRSAVVTELYAEIDRGRVRDIVAKVG